LHLGRFRTYTNYKFNRARKTGRSTGGTRRMPDTLFEKIWNDHVVVTSPAGEDLLYVDFNYMNEGGSFLAFDQLRLEGRKAFRPGQHLAITDHYLPSTGRAAGIEG